MSVRFSRLKDQIGSPPAISAASTPSPNRLVTTSYSGRVVVWDLEGERLGEELRVGLLLEGGREVASERLFILVALSTVLGASVLSYAAGRALGQRVGRALRETAVRTRKAVHAEDLGESPADLPEVGEAALDPRLGPRLERGEGCRSANALLMAASGK